MYWLTKLAKHKMAMTLVAVFVFGLLLAPAFVAAEAPDLYLGLGYGEQTGLGKKDVRETVARIINVALSLLGIVAVVIILLGGFKWMVAGGNEEKVAEARKLIFAGVIGLAIILSAYAIARFVMERLYEATTGLEYEGIEDAI